MLSFSCECAQLVWYWEQILYNFTFFRHNFPYTYFCIMHILLHVKLGRVLAITYNFVLFNNISEILSDLTHSIISEYCILPYICISLIFFASFFSFGRSYKSGMKNCEETDGSLIEGGLPEYFKIKIFKGKKPERTQIFHTNILANSGRFCVLPF